MKPTSKWQKFIRSKQDHSGLFLVQMNDGAIHLGQFYCGAFVRDGFFYNNTPGMISQIKFIQAVKPILALIVLIAFPILAAPPELPHYTPKPRPLKHTAGSKEGALVKMSALSKVLVKKAWTAMHIEWSHYGPGTQFIRFDIGARYSVGTPLSNSVVIATTSKMFYDLSFTNSPQMYPAVRAWDIDQPKRSEWMPVGLANKGPAK